jgi:hypothetical protein
LPRDLKKRSAPLGSFPVVFYGQNDYAFVPGQSIKPFLISQLEEHLSQLKKKPVKGLKEAIALAQDAPNSVDFVYNLHQQEQEEEEEVEVVERFVTQEGEIEYSKKSKSSKKRTATAAAATESFNEESSVGSSSALTSKKKKKKKKLNSESSSKSESEILLGLRHKLQRIFLGDTLKTEDFGKVNDLMEEVERFNVTFDLLRVTLIVFYLTK